MIVKQSGVSESRWFRATVLALGAVGLLQCVGFGEILEFGGGKYLSEEASTSADETIVIQVPGMDETSSTEVTYVDLTFDSPWNSGTEVEAWPVLGTEPAPWERHDLPVSKCLWVMDERTGPLVRFDLTPFVDAWRREALPNLGIVIRVTENPGGMTMSTARQGWSGIRARYITIPGSPKVSSVGNGGPERGHRPRVQEEGR